MGKAHPSFYHVLQLLQEETVRIHQDIEKLEAGQSPPRKKEMQVLNSELHELSIGMKPTEQKITSLVTYVP
ncbi:hypothetical protein ANN_22237 [Periplaneta americana]|uniref:Uncharacterized protein n=1 Tax=Periplaneta americana TaxID=6978 RepID=A0ABQ8S7K7_PERAM|nr:hypothetical protein ANN_22237 [Periplaneta americana]